MIRLPADGGSGDDMERSSETDITEAEVVLLSCATWGTPLKTCERDDCCQLPSSGNQAAPDASAPKEEIQFPQFSYKLYEPHTEIVFPLALRKHTKQPIFYGNEKGV